MDIAGLAEAAGDGRKFGFTLGGSLIWFDFAANAKDVSGGNGDQAEQCLVSGPVVTIGVVGWYTAFIPKGDLDLIPGEADRISRHSGIDHLGGITSGES
jgi:hypothetical protein